MIRLSAFADEISDDPEEQLTVLKQHGIRYVELRSAWGTPVLDLTDSQVMLLRGLLADASTRISAIASPIAKSPVDGPFDVDTKQLRRAISLCDAFDCSSIRVFSYYPPQSHPGAAPSEWANQAVERLQGLAALTAGSGVTLLHENDVGLYGQTIAGSVEILEQIPDQHLKAILDPANFLLAGQAPYPDGYQAMKARIESVHVKDAHDRMVVPAGQGAGRFPELLHDMRSDGFDGVFALEPHLQRAGRFTGFSGPDLFARAAGAFKKLLAAASWEWS